MSATRCLTLWQPYAWGISDGGKYIENRPLPPPASVIGKPLAIAAAVRRNMRYEAEAAGIIRARTGTVVPPCEELVRGAVVAVVVPWKVVDARRDPTLDARMREEYGWWLGPVGIFLRNVVKIPPIDLADDTSFHRGYWAMSDALCAEVTRRAAANGDRYG